MSSPKIGRKVTRKGQARLEDQHRVLTESFIPVPLIAASPIEPGERYLVQTFTTYGAYEEPIR